LSIVYLFYVGIHLFLNGFYFSPYFGFHLGQYVFSVGSHHNQQACKHLFRCLFHFHFNPLDPFSQSNNFWHQLSHLWGLSNAISNNQTASHTKLSHDGVSNGNWIYWPLTTCNFS
jgi:hypothetical protein